MPGHRRFVLGELIGAVFRSVLPRSRANYDSRTLSECREKMWLLCGEMELKRDTSKAAISR